MNKDREVDYLRSIAYDLEQALQSAATFERVFTADTDRDGLSKWAHLDTALNNALDDVHAMLRERATKYRVVGIVTEHLIDGHRAPLTEWSMNAARRTECDPAPDYDTYEGALQRLHEVRGTSQEKEGYEKYLFYIKEVRDA